jgi:hypothetical protein
MQLETRIEKASDSLRARARAAFESALACLIWLALVPQLARAEPLRVLLLGAQEAELTARVHGQTRDLPLLLDVVDPGVPLGREQAERLGREHAAQVVVWSEATGNASLRVYVLDLESAQLRARDVVAPERETLAASTTAEIAALVVRSELSSSLAERDAALAAAAISAPPPAPAPAPAPPASEPARPAASPPPAPGPWLLAAGYRLSLPIAYELGQAGTFALRRDVASFAIGVGAYAAGPLQLERAGTQVRVQRFGLRFEALWGATLTHTRLWLGAAAGCTGSARSTQEVGGDQRRTSDALNWSGNLGPLAELHWQPLRYLGLYLALGIDFVLWRTKFAYEDASGVETLDTFSPLEPWATAGLFTRLGR